MAFEFPLMDLLLLSRLLCDAAYELFRRMSVGGPGNRFGRNVRRAVFINILRKWFLIFDHNAKTVVLAEAESQVLIAALDFMVREGGRGSRTEDILGI